MDENILNNFPGLLKAKLMDRSCIFPEETQYDYRPIYAYRIVKRKFDDFSEITREDFKSYAEENKRSREDLSNPYNMAKYCSVSMSLSFEVLQQLFNFPAGEKNNKIIAGNIESTNGPIWQDSEVHIHWWLYENADLSDFVYVDGDE